LQQRTEERLQELLREDDFAGAITLLLECQNAASSFRHFTCVAALNGQLQDTLLMAEESLDQALAKVGKLYDILSFLLQGYCIDLHNNLLHQQSLPIVF
jgi:hypothetical protein